MNRSLNEIAYRADFAKRCRRYADAIEAVLDNPYGRVYPDGDVFFVGFDLCGRVYVHADLDRSPKECTVSIIDDVAILNVGSSFSEVFGTKEAAERHAATVGGLVYNVRQLMAEIAFGERWLAGQIEAEQLGEAEES